MRRISEREQELPDTMLGELQRIATENKSIISLSIGAPDFMTPKPILEHIKTLVKNAKSNNMTRYTASQGIPELRQAIAKKLIKENKIKHASPENIQVGTGSQEVFFSALLSITDPTEEIIMPCPGYMAYIPAIELVNGIPVFLKLRQSDNFEINPDKLKKAITKKTQALILNSPSNPTGCVLSRKTLEEIAKVAIEKDIYIISDEAYEHLVYDKPHISIASLNGMKDYVCSMFTFSKSYAMCGFRVGYAIGPDKLIKAMTEVNQYMTLCPPHISQLLALKALQIPKKYIEQMKLEYRKRRDFIVKRLNQIGLETPMPDGAFYAFPNIQSTAMTSIQFTKHLLSKAKVAVTPGNEFGPYGEGYARFSYANSMQNIKKAMEKIEKII